MLSEKAEKTKNIYKRMSFLLSLGVAEPGNVSKFMAGFVEPKLRSGLLEKLDN